MATRSTETLSRAGLPCWHISCQKKNKFGMFLKAWHVDFGVWHIQQIWHISGTFYKTLAASFEDSII